MASTTAVEVQDSIKRAQQETLKKEYSGKAGQQFISEVKDSMLFHCNWAELLSAAPMALSLMGSCWVAASKKEAAEISLQDAMPKGGFKYISLSEREPRLRAALLVVCNNGGNKAFTTAGVNMAKIRGTSGELKNKIERILQALQNIHQPGMQDTLNDLLDELRDLSDRCMIYSEEIQKAFDTWLLMVSELHTATEQKSGNVSQEQAENISKKAAADIEQQYTQKSLETATAAAGRMKESLDKAEKVFQKANDNVPSAWETCLMTAVNGLTQAAPSMIAGALPLVLAAANPVMAVAPAIVALSGGKDTGKKGPGGENGNAKVRKINKMAAQTLPVSNDPAYVAAALVSAFFTTFYSYLTAGEGGTIDWTKFDDKSATDNKVISDGKRTQGLTWLITNLSLQKENVEFSEEQPSLELKKAFEDAISIAEDIKKSVQNKQQLTSEEVSQETIKDWAAKMKAAKETVIKLEAVAKTAPGTSNNVPASHKDVKIDILPTDHSSQNAAISAATQKLAMNQQALNSSQENYQKAVTNQSSIEGKMAQIKAKLASLEGAEKTLTNVKAILLDCIDILADLRVQIGKIRQFFIAINVMVEHVVKTHVASFDKHVSRVSGTSAKMGILTINDLTKQMIFTSSLQISAYFELLVDIATMYSQVHLRHIVQGLDLCDKMAKGGNDSTLGARAKEIDSYTEDARKAIMDLAEQRQQEITKTLKARADRVAQEIQMLEDAGVPMPDKGIQDAIKQGAERNTEQAKKGFEDVPDMGSMY